MSRIGKAQIQIPENVEVTKNGQTVIVKGPNGELSAEIRPEIKVIIEDGVISTKIEKDTKQANAYWGLSRALIANMIEGVKDGFEKKLELEGVGYRVTQAGNKLSITAGYSNPVEYEAPEGITFDVPDNKNITVKGIDKQLVGHVAAQIRKIRKPEPYKGKGIKYEGEVIRRKAGKAGKV